MSFLLNHQQSKSNFKTTGVTWRFKVLYDRHLDLLAEEKLLGDDPDAETIRSYKARSIYGNSNGSKRFTPSLNRYSTSRSNIPNNSSSTLSQNGEFSLGSNSSISTSVGGGSRSMAATQNSGSTHNVTVLIPKTYAIQRGHGIDEEIIPTA